MAIEAKRNNEQEPQPLKQVTICFPLREGEILLARKKRGLGARKWNGAGGRVEVGESVKEGAVRECEEELRIKIDTADLEKMAEITFSHPHIPTPENSWIAHVFIVRKWQGEPRETEEMIPQWFPLEKIPYQEMWSNDIYWLRKVLSGEKIIGKIDLDENGEILAIETNRTPIFPS